MKNVATPADSKVLDDLVDHVKRLQDPATWLAEVRAVADDAGIPIAYVLSLPSTLFGACGDLWRYSVAAGEIGRLANVMRIRAARAGGESDSPSNARTKCWVALFDGRYFKGLIEQACEAEARAYAKGVGKGADLVSEDRKVVSGYVLPGPGDADMAEFENADEVAKARDALADVVRDLEGGAS